MKSSLLTLLALSLFAATSWAQESRSDSLRSSVYFELAGNAVLYSINYERRVADNLAVRLGISFYDTRFFAEWGTQTRVATVPVMASYLIGKHKSKLEIGAGFLFGTRSSGFSLGSGNDGSSTIFDFTAVLGYRLQNLRARRIFRVGITPFFPIKGIYPDNAAFISFGFGGGIMF